MDNTQTSAIQRLEGVSVLKNGDHAIWRLTETVRGPFDAIFGGIAAAILAEEVARVASTRSFLASLSVDFVRSIQPGDIAAEVRIAQRGRRLTWFDIQLTQFGKTAVLGRIIHAECQNIANLPMPSWTVESAPPEMLERVRSSPAHDGPWLGDLLDVRADAVADVYWFRVDEVTPLGLSPSAFAVAMADFVAGVSRPDSWETPVVKAFPNPSMTVSLNREPEGLWVGLHARSVWSASGLGIAGGELIDQCGVFGMVQQINVLMR